ncbi:PREDICTED: O-acyltransferase WSD1-like [Ipomoea nil]|uniref:O-acyltransferase WSD1-like n=1 Tax=Ipomoea nil TaxID=35883 RepID=UPI000901D00C|nr:PREDICTED: O-acyltransferase WSD1-like [Ipomoea nil]
MATTALNPIDINGEKQKHRNREAEEPASPATLLFHTTTLNCCIVAILGYTTKLNVDVIKKGLECTLVNHPRFSSILAMGDKRWKKRWIPTKVNVDDHIICPDLEPDMQSADEFVENYASSLTTKSLDMSKPLWELHILNVKTSEANSIAIFKIHHSLGDGISLISLVLACFRKTSDPNSLPTIPSSNRTRPKIGFFRQLFLSAWLCLTLILNTLVDITLFLATILFLKDTNTPLKAKNGDAFNPRRLVHRIVNLDDVKLVKNAMNVTINDVMMGMLQAGLSRYLNRKYGIIKGSATNNKNNLPKNFRLRGAIMFNIRSSTGIKALAEMMEKKSRAKWGNKIGLALAPLFIGFQENPLDYIYKAKATIDRKKLSMESRFSFTAARIVLKLFGVQVAAALTNRALSNTTIIVSNVVGPQEEISFFGHTLVFISPAVYGLPHSLAIHFQSYCNKMTISMAVDPKVIPDPYQLCDDFEESLAMFKEAVVTTSTLHALP